MYSTQAQSSLALYINYWDIFLLSQIIYLVKWWIEKRISWAFQGNFFWWPIKPGEIFNFLQLGFWNGVSQPYMHENFLSSIALSVIHRSFIPPKLWLKLKHLRDTKRGLCCQQSGAGISKIPWVLQGVLVSLKNFSSWVIPQLKWGEQLTFMLGNMVRKIILNHYCTPCQNKLTQRPQVYPGSQKTICGRLYWKDKFCFQKEIVPT